MRKTILVGAALLVSAAPAAAHNAGMTIDCDAASITYSYFPTYMDSTITSTITLDGALHYTQTNTIRRSGTINIPLAISGTREVMFRVSWVSDTNGSRTLTDTLECPPGTPPVIDEPTPEPPVVPPVPTPEPPPQVTTPTVPTPPVPPKPVKPKTCAQLKAAGVGTKWLRKRGCIKTSTAVVKACPPGKRRASLRVIGPNGKARIYTRCVSLVPAVTG